MEQVVVEDFGGVRIGLSADRYEKVGEIEGDASIIEPTSGTQETASTLKETLVAFARTIADGINEIPVELRPSELKIETGLTFGANIKAWVFDAGGKQSVSMTLTWRR